MFLYLYLYIAISVSSLYLSFLREKKGRRKRETGKTYFKILTLFLEKNLWVVSIFFFFPTTSSYSRVNGHCFFFLLEMGSCCVAKASLELLALSNPPVFSSQSAGITVMTNHYQPFIAFITSILRSYFIL